MTLSRTLTVVVDYPPDVAHIVLPSLEQGLVHVAFVEFGVADERDHATLEGIVGAEPLCPHIVLGGAGKQRHGDAETDRAGGEIDVVGVLGARGIGLRPAQRAEPFQLLLRLPAQQILDCVKHRARVRLDGDPIGRARTRPYTRSTEGETARLIASTSRVPKGRRPPGGRSSPATARSPWSSRRPSPSAA